MMPSFFGAAEDAAKAGYTVKQCAHCANWHWWPPEHELTEATRKAGRVFCSRRECERAEGLARAAENPRPTYKVLGRMGVDLETFAIDEFDASWQAEELEQIRALGWLDKVRFDGRSTTVMRVS